VGGAAVAAEPQFTAPPQNGSLSQGDGAGGEAGEATGTIKQHGSRFAGQVEGGW